ncbi:MAG: hypothetical protein LAT81_03535 [Oceanicaulis sp.]|nr:hypothetical protein [Oceanicaulis sp.]
MLNRSILIAALVMSVSGSLAFGQSARPVQDDRYCNLSGFEKPLRQTILIVDEHNIFPEAPGAIREENTAWRRFVSQFLDADDASIETRLQARERLTVVVASSDGGGTTTLFSGCVPFFSAEERANIRSSSGWRGSMDQFFGSGPVADASAHATRLRAQFAARMAIATQSATPMDSRLPDASLADSALINSLSRGAFFNLVDGVPRIILFSDLSRFDEFSGASAPSRTDAIERAGRTGLNLNRAELHIVGTRGASNAQAVRRYLQAFFLQVQADLRSINPQGSLPQFEMPPHQVQFFIGRIRYPTGTHPMRMRLAVDANGTAANSWVSVQTDAERSTPFSGVMTCRDDRQCSFVGDRVFAQVWGNRDGDPVFESWMPFAGLREFEFEIDGSVLEGRASDSLVDLQGVSDNALSFQLNKSEGGAF